MNQYEVGEIIRACVHEIIALYEVTEVLPPLHSGWRYTARLLGTDVIEQFDETDDIAKNAVEIMQFRDILQDIPVHTIPEEGRDLFLGYRILSRIDPTWVERLDLKILNLGDCEKCIIGQAFGTYMFLREEHPYFSLLSADQMAYLGFDLHRSECSLINDFYTSLEAEDEDDTFGKMEYNVFIPDLYTYADLQQAHEAELPRYLETLKKGELS